MQIAIHIRKFLDTDPIKDIKRGLASFFGDIDFNGTMWERKFQFPERLYIGDEFCPIRMPDLAELKQICRFARENHMGLTLLTPILTEPWLEKYILMLDCLKNEFPHAEVVVNDLGVLFYLGKQYPEFNLSMGRLFNRGFKDPRLSVCEISSSGKEFLSDCTFDHLEFREMAVNQGVSRLERDLLPYADRIFDSHPGLNSSCYFPFGYVTSGRVCWTATFNQSPGKKFMPVQSCSRPCESFPLELKHESLSFKLFQSGNTIFYLYTLSMLTALFQKAETENIRLVYQGGIL